VEGEPTRDVWGVDIRRFGEFHKSPTFLRDRVQEVLGLHYAMPWPRKELQSARGLRKTPLFGELEKKGAVFGQKFGWERVNYFIQGDEDEKERVSSTYTVDKPPAWLNYVRDEHIHTRTKVSLFDVSSFAKLKVKGKDAEKAMQRLCCADVSELNRAVYTGMLNERGGYETDCTVTRLAEDEFIVVSPTAQATRDADWMRRNIEDWNMNDSVQVSDISSSMCVLALMGPRSRDLLSEIMLQKLDDESFPFGTVRDVSIGHVAARLCRMTYVYYFISLSLSLSHTLIHTYTHTGTLVNLDMKSTYPQNPHYSCTRHFMMLVRSSNFEIVDTTPSIRCVSKRHIEHGDTN
jgi:heterotetrameric sarcosine oxidase gamma subunit